MSVRLKRGRGYRENFGIGASANLIQLALRLESDLNVEYLARAVMSLCAIVEKQQREIESLQQQCAAVRTDLRRANAKARCLG